MGKYDAITERLQGLDQDHVRASFEELEVWLGFGLPPSARRHQPWWSDSKTTWRQAGWNARSSFRTGSVTFVRSADVPAVPRRSDKRTQPMTGRAAQMVSQPAALDGLLRKWCDQEFSLVSDIEPLRGVEDALLEFMPQEHYANQESLPLLKEGVGPFCRFSIPANYQMAGVYVVTVDGEVRYVGEAANLTKRYNMGYGNISPRNCFRGGQATNCRINNLILQALKSTGASVQLWFQATSDYKALEKSMITRLRPIWNRKGNRDPQ